MGIIGNKSNIIVKSNHLIEASYRLTLMEQRILYIVISMIEKNDKDFRPYEFDILDFMKAIDIDGQSTYSYLKDVTRLLRSRVFTVRYGSTELQTGWITDVQYKTKEGKILFYLSPLLKPFLLEIKKEFTKLGLKNLIQLKSCYSTRIYELLKQYEGIGDRFFELEKLKNILGIGESEYRLYAHFKSRVILPAQKELKEKTDIFFEFEEIREGRKVAKIRFTIHSRNKIEEPMQPTIQDGQQTELGIAAEANKFIRRFWELTGAEFAPHLALRMVEEKGVEAVNMYLDNWGKFDSKAMDNVAGFFFKAVMEGYAIPKRKRTAKKPVEQVQVPQHFNFKQREYDDEYYDSFFNSDD